MKWTVITGACGGLGKEFCTYYAQKNQNLICIGTDEQRLTQLKQECARFDIEIITYLCDLSNEQAVINLCKQLDSYEIERLINNAGFGAYGRFETMDLTTILTMQQVNMTSLTLLTHAVLSKMKQTGGEILNVASTAAFEPGPMMALYYASKAFVLSFSEALSMEMEGTKVKVCAMCPGPIETNFSTRAQMKHTWMQKWLMISAKQAVEIGCEALSKGKTRIIVGKKNQILIGCSNLVPHELKLKIMSNIQNQRNS